MEATDNKSHSPGCRVYDRDEGPGTSLIIVETHDTPCDEWQVPNTGRTVADFNEEYPADASVCVAAFASSLYDSLLDWESMEPTALAEAIQQADVKTYSYPAPRLKPYETDDSSCVPAAVTTYFELICYQHARLIQLAADVDDFGFLWTKHEKLVDGKIEMASITKENMYQLQSDFGVCTYCGEEAETQYDHIIPISDGGPAEISNQVPACVSCNMEKQNSDPIDWCQDRGMPVPRLVWGKYLKLYRDRLAATGRLHDRLPEVERERWDGIKLTRNITNRIRTSHLKRDEAGRESVGEVEDSASNSQHSANGGQSTLSQWE